MLKNTKKIIFYLILALSLLGLVACSDVLDQPEKIEDKQLEEDVLTEDGSYYELEEVVSYLEKFKKLPKNYLTKKEAKNLGWQAQEGNLWEVTDRMLIGGDVFHNREKKLPVKEGRKYYEADINYEGGRRDAQRIIYSNDGLIYYTKDHYKSFELLRGQDD